LAAAALLLGALHRWGLPGYGFFAPRSDLAMEVDVRVYVTGVILTFVSGLLFGMIPARKVWETNPLQAMKSGPVDVAGRRRLTLRDLLLAAQIMICTLLVIASFVAVRGVVRLLHAPLGFQPEGAMVAEMDQSEVEGDVPLEKIQAMLDALRSMPGTTAVGTTSRIPFNGGLRGIPVFPPGTTEFSLNNSVLSPYGFTISPGFLETARTRLLHGRDVSWRDTTKTPYVAIVNEAFARKMWGDTPALGQRFIFLDHLREVIGVVEDGKYANMEEPPQPAVLLPLSQNERTHTVFILRSPRAPNELAAAIEHTLLGFEPNALLTVRSWPETMEVALFPGRAATVAIGIMALLAAVVAVTGIFGMAAYNVSRRMKELGIRVALGARTRHVMTAAVGRPIMLLGIGSFAGLLGGLFASRFLGQIVYQANPRDPIVILGAVLTMALLGLVASAIPAVRACAVDPCKLMRQE
jgi:predicted permease